MKNEPRKLRGQAAAVGFMVGIIGIVIAILVTLSLFAPVANNVTSASANPNMTASGQAILPLVNTVFAVVPVALGLAALLFAFGVFSRG